MRRRLHSWSKITMLAVVCLGLPPALQSQTPLRTIELVADKDSRYKMPDGGKAEITLKAGEQVVLRFTAIKGKTWARNGAVHGFTLLRAKDRKKVPGWDLELAPGAQEFTLTAPTEPGEYLAVCTVICSENHEGMHLKVVVVP